MHIVVIARMAEQEKLPQLSHSLLMTGPGVLSPRTAPLHHLVFYPSPISGPRAIRSQKGYSSQNLLCILELAP